MTAQDLKPIIVKTNGKEEGFELNRLQLHLMQLVSDLNLSFIDINYVINQVQIGLPQRLHIDELINLLAETLASLTTRYYQYSNLASRVLQHHLQKQLPKTFSDNAKILFSFDTNRLNSKRFINEKVMKVIEENTAIINAAIVPERDYLIDYFGFRTLEKSYLLRTDRGIHETPQYLFMRVALGIHTDDIDAAIETYHLMSQKYFVHASPTLFNSGTDFANLSSCFLLAMNDDSIDGIFKTVHETAIISKASGGVGLHVSNIRASGTYISGTNGTSSGLVPMLRVFNNTAKYVDQGGNKRPGAFCIYLEPWHADVFAFLDLRKNHGKEELRARDLFYALWIPSLFMEKVERDEEWCLFSPDKCPGLTDAYGEEFNKLYNKYESEGKYMKKVRAQKLWNAILVSQTETGNPFLLYKDSCNEKSNQKNLGTIKSSNLCCEIIEYSSPDEIAVCNLASVALPAFVENGEFCFKKLHQICKIIVKNLNKIIDIGEYPLDKCKTSNSKSRPIGLGVQGLADVFFKLGMPFGSKESRKLNIQIFETIYHAALESSMELAIKYGTYETYEGSPMSKGVFQFDMWNTQPTNLWDWSSLKHEIASHGIRNSLLVALMPTASTSQILGYNECFEPITSNIYTRRVISGEHQVVNKYLIDDLVSLGLWNDDIKDKIIYHEGSIQAIEEIPDHLKELYKTVWEMSQKIIIDMAADRAPFVDQSQSMNLFMQDVSFSKLTSMHFYAWKSGLKTGIYYLRTKAASSAIKFTVSSHLSTSLKKRKMINELNGNEQKKRPSSNGTILDTEEEEEEKQKDDKKSSFNIYDNKIIACNLQDPEGCESCSS